MGGLNKPVRTYSGYMDGGKAGSGPKQKVSWMQVVPLALAAIIFLVFIVIRGGFGSPKAAETDGLLSFHYAVKTADGYKTVTEDAPFKPSMGEGVLYTLEKGFKEPPDKAGYLRTADSNAYINNLYTDGSSAVINFSTTPAANVAEAEKTVRLQAIAYTIGDYFYVNNVVITVNGEIIYEMDYSPF